ADTVLALPPLSVSTTLVPPLSPVTVPPTVYAAVAQLTATFVMSAVPAIPTPLATEHICDGLDGCVPTTTAYGNPVNTGVGNANAPSPVIARSSAPLSRKTSPDPTRPVTVPPIIVGTGTPPSEPLAWPTHWPVNGPEKSP